MNTDKIKPDRFMTMASYVWQSCTGTLLHDDLSDTMHLMCPQWKSLKLPFNIDRQMAGVVSEVSLSLSDQTNLSDRWREAVRHIKASGKPFDFWAIFNCDRRPVDRSVIIKDCQMPLEEYDHLMKEVGDLFLGWEIGEWDGLYARDVVPHWTPRETPRTRKEGYEKFITYIRHLHDLLYGNTNALCGMPYAHYFNELPVRMVGAETSQGLLNTQLYVASLRGACHQYGMAFKLITSIFDRWGHTDFVNALESQPDPKDSNRAGPFEGHTLGLLRALWITGYLAGAAIMGHEGAFYTNEVESGRRKFSPTGQAMRELTRWAKAPQPRGKQIRPLALMLDYFAGWAPPRHYYSSIAECVVWHAVPYGPSDYAMDRAFDCFYPGYLDSGFYRDERGFLAPTPCGDVADILLNDATLEAMQAYPVIWLLTDEVLGDDCRHRLRQYVESGGHLIVGGPPMVQLSSSWFDLDFSTEAEGVASFYGAGETMMRESYFGVRVCGGLPPTWCTHAHTEKSDPLIASTHLGLGEVTFIAADHGLTDELILPAGRLRDFAPLVPHGFELLHAVKRYAREVVERHMPLRISGKDIYYCVNRLDEDTLVVCLYNPGWASWEGSIQLAVEQPCDMVELKGPWGGEDRRSDGSVHLESNQTRLFKVFPVRNPSNR